LRKAATETLRRAVFPIAEEMNGADMKPILTLAAAAALSSLIGLNASQAAPAGPQSAAPVAQTAALAQPVHYHSGPYVSYYRGPRFGYYHGPNVTFAYWRRPYHGAAFYGPAYRYGYGAALYGAPYYSAVGDYPACRAWAHECAVRWGWQTWRWERCMRIHAC
jgi:hypothetical protein